MTHIKLFLSSPTASYRHLRSPTSRESWTPVFRCDIPFPATLDSFIPANCDLRMMLSRIAGILQCPTSSPCHPHVLCWCEAEWDSCSKGTSELTPSLVPFLSLFTELPPPPSKCSNWLPISGKPWYLLSVPMTCFCSGCQPLSTLLLILPPPSFPWSTCGPEALTCFPLLATALRASASVPPTHTCVYWGWPSPS